MLGEKPRRDVGHRLALALLQSVHANRRNNSTNTLGAMPGVAPPRGGLIPSAATRSPRPLYANKGGFAERNAVCALPAICARRFAFILRFAGGGNYAPGRVMVDPDGNLWSGSNWMPGSQASAVLGIGGGVAKFGPDGAALSPPVTGFTGAGINEIGWGTAVTRENVWASSFNGKILVMDFQGRPVATEQDFPFKEKLHGLMGIGVSAKGDVWIADGEGDQLLYFPGGRVKEGKIVKPAGLAESPFDVVIDDQDRVWVSNSRSFHGQPNSRPMIRPRWRTSASGWRPAPWPSIRRAMSGSSASCRRTFRA